jgi:tetratricopeptide (TPR) repeat protein
MQARWHIGRLTKQDNERAVELLEDAISAAPNLAGAHSALAICHIHAQLHAWRTDSLAAIAQGEECARTAVNLDANDAEARAILGMACIFSRKFDDALEHLNRAIRLNPNLANAYGTLNAARALNRDYEGSREAVQKALALSPRDSSLAFWYAGWGIAAFIAGKYEECIEVGQNSLRNHNAYASSLRQITASYGMLDRTEEAKASLEQLLDRMPGLTLEQVRNIVPFKYPEDQDRFLEGLRKAGLPE